MSALTLHNYFRSSTSVRVRVALNMKGLAFDYVSHHLRRGENRSPVYLQINPHGLVSSLMLEDGSVLTQSVAIIEYLDEEHPSPPLLPKNAGDRARVRALALSVACEIHPLNNLRVLDYLQMNFGADKDVTAAWFRHGVAETFEPLEAMLSNDPRTDRYCHGDEPGLADICLYAQVLNNRRFAVDMEPYHTMLRIFEACAEVPAFKEAAPERQPDAE